MAMNKRLEDLAQRLSEGLGRDVRADELDATGGLQAAFEELLALGTEEATSLAAACVLATGECGVRCVRDKETNKVVGLVEPQVTEGAEIILRWYEWDDYYPYDPGWELSRCSVCRGCVSPARAARDLCGEGSYVETSVAAQAVDELLDSTPGDLDVLSLTRAVASALARRGWDVRQERPGKLEVSLDLDDTGLTVSLGVDCDDPGDPRSWEEAAKRAEADFLDLFDASRGKPESVGLVGLACGPMTRLVPDVRRAVGLQAREDRLADPARKTGMER